MDYSTSKRCWQCGKKLEKHPRTGELIFDTVDMPMGTISVRVHKICKADALLVVYPNVMADVPQGHTKAKVTV